MSGQTTSKQLTEVVYRGRHDWVKRLLSIKVIVPTVLFAVVLTVWQFLVPAMGMESYLLPTPSEIVAAFLVHREAILGALAVTLKEFGVGFGLTLVSEYVLALLMFESMTLEVAFYPYLIVVRSIPTVALVPLFIIWFGFGTRTVVIVTYLIGFFPMVVNSLSGFKSTDDELVQMLESFSANRLDVYRNVFLYSALPTVFAGIKICVVLAFTGAIVGEFLIASHGIGALILEYNTTFETSAMFASIFVVTATELLVYGAVIGIQRLVIDWT